MGFIIASLLFLGGFGGVILYVIAWIIVPEEGKDGAVTRATFSGRPWHDWDRTARSWALVLGALALALIWSFGVWPWWHWRLLPFWLVGLAAVLWLLARHREGSGSAAPPAWGSQAAPPAGPVPRPGPGPGPGQGPDGPGGGFAPGAPAPGPTSAPSSTEPAPAAGAGQAAAYVASVNRTDAGVPYVRVTGNPGGTGGADVSGSPAETNGGNGPAQTMPEATPPAAAAARPLGSVASLGPADPGAGSDADWAAAKTAAADWAAGQLALAGVPAKTAPKVNPSAAPSVSKPTVRSSAARGLRRAVRLVLALVAAVVLLAVLTAVGVTLGTGSSLKGGVGDNTFAPVSASAVKNYYRLGAGNLDLNLSNVTFPVGGQSVRVTVGLGNLTVQVPQDAVVTVDARTGIGQVDVFGNTGSNVRVTSYGGAGAPENAPHLNLNAHVGLGDLQVTQG